MKESNFYAYMYSSAMQRVTLDEGAENIDLTDAQSIQKGFVSYLNENPPPYNLKEAIEEEKFYRSEGEGKNGDKVYIRYDMSIPGVAEEVEEQILKEYFEEFLEAIGIEENKENKRVVEVDTHDNERGGIDIEIYIALSGPQVENKGAL